MDDRQFNYITNMKKKPWEDWRQDVLHTHIIPN
jgi:hypothetical protein